MPGMPRCRFGYQLSYTPSEPESARSEDRQAAEADLEAEKWKGEGSRSNREVTTKIPVHIAGCDSLGLWSHTNA